MPDLLRRSIVLVALLLAVSPALQAQETNKTEATLKSGDNGPAVEGLQRLLNARLTPSPELTVDGDFGDATRTALLRFQRANRLEPTGLADPSTRKALGPALAAEPPVPGPEVVNARIFEKKPADSPDGPPFTTCAAWAIADGKTGATLWGSSESKPLEMASTTKIMTALVILRLASTNPSILEETVVFSDRADKTVGSTSGVRAGEKVAVKELLYGLLLPSGNDAAEAFAEHFGMRFAPVGGSVPNDPAAGFVAEMNRVAASLNLAETHFANPHGLPAAGHKSSARDLARLASAAMADPGFTRIVATPQRGARLIDSSGQSRNVIWSNTNKLLDYQGYDGIKTGTTTGAGACLVASGRKGEDHLIIVILGSPSSDGRYVDARNLFRWAWRQRETTPSAGNARPKSVD